MSDIFHKHRLSDGRAIWIQRHKIKGVRKPSWSVVVSYPDWLTAPDIVEVEGMESGLKVLADLLQEDVCEVL